MKKTLFIPVMLLALAAAGQPGKTRPSQERIESMKIAYLTERLDLNPEEAKQFWPVYNQYQNALEEMRKKHRQERDVKNMESLADKDVEKMVDNEMIFRQKELDIKKAYYSQLKSVLPIKKVAKLYMTEDDFKRVLLRKIQERRHREEPGRR